MRRCKHRWELVPLSPKLSAREPLTGGKKVSLLRCIKCNYRTTVTEDEGRELLAKQQQEDSGESGA